MLPSRPLFLRLMRYRLLAQFTTTLGDGEVYSGFVQGLGRELVVFQEVRDFLVDGFTVMRLSDVKSVRSNRFDPFAKGLLEREGLLSQVGLAEPVGLESIRSVMASIARPGRLVIVETKRQRHMAFHLGEIIRVDGTRSAMRSVDAVGRKGRRPVMLEHASVARIEFGSRYITLFSKYVHE